MEINPLVTVCMTAYNQAKYIVDAIEGVLMQQTNFAFELLIGEDSSTKDNTLEICRNYEKQYPDIIKVVYDGKNYGMVANEQRLMNAAQGKYIAFCEADDYWIDPQKLQKQVDILKKNLQYSACACQSRVIYGTNKEKWKLLSKSTEDRTITLNDILNTEGEFQTASFIFLAKNIRNITPMPVTINGWDRAVFILNAYKGDIYWLKDEMAVYRKNEDGISSWVTFDLMKRDIDMIPWFFQVDVKFPLNALKSHIYYGIISNAREINVFNLLKYYVYILFYIRKSEIDMTVLKQGAKKTLEYRMPRFLRRVFRKIKIL